MSRLGRFVRRKWVKRMVRGLFALVLLLIVGAIITRYVVRSQGKQRLAEQIAKLDADEPRWRWDDIEAERPLISDPENSATLIPRFSAALDAKPWRLGNPNEYSKESLLVPNCLPGTERIAAIRSFLQKHPAAINVALLFRQYPRGRHHIRLTKPLWRENETFAHLGQYDALKILLMLDAERLLVEWDANGALAHFTLLLNAARALDGEPSSRSQIKRGVLLLGATHIVQRATALGEPRTGLAEIQAQCIQLANEEPFFIAVRGERALGHSVYQNVESGEVAAREISHERLTSTPRVIDPTFGPGPSLIDKYHSEWFASMHLPDGQALFLEEFTKMIGFREIAEERRRMLLDEQSARLRIIPADHLDGRSNAATAVWIMQEKYADFLRLKAYLRCTAAGIAVERYRQMTGSWPKSLEAIPRNLLAKVPQDPFSGEPLKYQIEDDGVIVYSVGDDGVDDGGRVALRLLEKDGPDLVFRLYNPDQRRLPPLRVNGLDDLD